MANPRISDDLLEFFASGVDVYVATRSSRLNPEAILGMGIRAHPDRRTLTVYVPTAQAATTLENLRDNAQLAATLCRPPDHRAVQLKGICTAIRECTESDRELQEVFRAALISSFAAVGVPRSLTRRLEWWPSTAIDFALTSIFKQAPGPDAGEPLHG